VGRKLKIRGGQRRTTRADSLTGADILNILVLHTGQTPSVAGRPFFIVTDLAFVISRVVLHFMQ
jgi:hypothetical protein